MTAVEFVPEPPGSGSGRPPGPPTGPPDGFDDALDIQPSPRQRSVRLGKRSLTARLVAGVALLVIVLVMTVGAITYYELRSFLYQRLDQQVVPLAESNAVQAQQYVEHLRVASNESFRGTQKVWIGVLTPAGTASTELTVRNSDGLEKLSLRVPTAQSLVNHPDDPVTVSTTEGETLRVSVHEIDTEIGQLYIATGVSVEDVTETLHRLIAIELIIGGAAVAVALMMTYGGVQLSLRGLRRVTTTAQEVAAELGPSGVALQRRVPVTEQGTEVAQLTDSMNTLLQATETQFAARVESEERMRQFLADASHELRTPLTSIRGYAELARMQRAVGGREDEDNLGRIEAEGTRMSRLVEDLLMLARGDDTSTEPHRAFIDTDQLIGDAVSGARAAFPDRQIEIDAMLPHSVLGDPDQLLRVVRNLITNAVVHTPPGPPIRVRALSEGDGVAIQVVDGGPGLAPEDAAHVFERFWRADKARTRARGGSGLGLSIVASIVRAHGGTVRFDSTVERGSTVTVWLPAATGEA